MAVSIKRFTKQAISVVAVSSMMVVALAGPASAATLVADYQFQNTLSSSVGSAPALTEYSRYGAASTFRSEVVLGQNRTVWGFPKGNGLILNNANSLIGNSYSVVMLVKLDDIAGYKKLVDFKNGATDDGLYVSNSNLEAFGCGAASTSNPISSGTYAQVVMTRDTVKKIRLYVNGTQVANGDDTTDACALGSSTVLRFLHDDFGTCPTDATNCEESSGAIARLRLYNGALTPQEVAGLDTLPGSSPPPSGNVHNRSVSLSLRKHLVASGTVTATDGFSGCAQGVTVNITRKKAGTFRVVASTVTTTSGSFRKKLPDKPGTYRAEVPQVSAGGSETCGAAVSPTRRHIHRR